MEKVFAVKQVAEKLWATEEAIDGAMASTSALLTSVIETRRQYKVSAIVTDEATTKIAEAMKAMAEARAAMIGAHHALAEAKLRVGVRVKLDGGKPPIDKNIKSDETDEAVAA